MWGHREREWERGRGRRRRFKGSCSSAGARRVRGSLGGCRSRRSTKFGASSERGGFVPGKQELDGFGTVGVGRGERGRGQGEGYA